MSNNNNKGHGDRASRKAERGDRVSLAYHGLRELIVLGRLPPGARIIETTIANLLGVSRTPVRAALQRLEQEGYVVVTGPGQQSRMSVAALTHDDAMELFGVIAAVEGLAAHGAARRPAEHRADIARELVSLNARLLEVATSSDRDLNLLFTLNRTLHRRVVEAGAGPRLLALHDAVKPQAERYGRIYISALFDELSTSVREHDAMIDAIAAGDGAAAEAAMRLNWSNATRRLVDVISAFGETATW